MVKDPLTNAGDVRYTFFKKDANEFIYKTEINIDIKNKLMVTKGKHGKGRDKSGAWDEHKHVYYIR